jgi:hypothetical protein
MSTSVSPMLIVKWPYDLYAGVDVGKASANARMVAAAVAVGAAYWWGGGLPGQGQSLMDTATAYLVGGVGAYAVIAYSQ